MLKKFRKLFNQNNKLRALKKLWKKKKIPEFKRKIREMKDLFKAAVDARKDSDELVQKRVSQLKDSVDEKIRNAESYLDAACDLLKDLGRLESTAETNLNLLAGFIDMNLQNARTGIDNIKGAHLPDLKEHRTSNVTS